MLSVIIPSYNSAAYLAAAIESVLAQDFQPMEVIVVDDGSTDNTRDIIAAFPSLIAVSRQHGGPSAARNTGLNRAGGEFIGFHDADDLCLEGRFRLQMQRLVSDPEIGICLTQIQNFIEPGQNVPQSLTRPELMQPRMGLISSAVIRREVFDVVGGFDESYLQGEDIEWLARAKEKGIATAVIEQVLIDRRLHETNHSRDISAGHQSLIRTIRKSLKSGGSQPLK